ncbi:MAG: DUF4249 family protein [Bacteroidales bacterium]|nr:DUF4249 family protein [Bacteroidales bacterium]MBR5780695.1 DUF4249 family protein [Bacteroidales bacterium]
MKKINLLFLFSMIVCLIVFNSCSTDVEIYTEGDETTIVYGYLDVDADTNYVKITKSFVGDALTNGPIYQMSNYDYKLDVKLIGKFADMPNVVRTEILDTCSIYKPYDPDAIFYSGRNQLMYYTTRKLKENEKYELVIELKDGKIVKSTVETINGNRVSKPRLQISFESDISNQIQWKPNNLFKHAAYYEVVGYFHYGQLNPGETDTTYYKMRWYMGSGTAEELWNSSDYNMFVSYTPSNFYKQLESDNNFVNNSPDWVQRFVKGFEIVVTATGDELYNYILIQNSTGAIQDTPEYTNIENGMGIFSSRSQCSHTVKVSDHTINTLIRDYPQWGFVKVYN